MKINRLNPSGFCGGVNKALKILDEILLDSTTPKPIYLLGSIIHNSIIIDKYTSNGVILIDDPNKTRLELLDNIDNGTVIISAHGVSPKVYEKCKAKGLNIIDTTCSNVSIIHKRITDKLNNGYTCLYIGNKKHPECEGVLGIDSSIILLSNIDDVDNLYISNDKLYVTNQTTLSLLEIEDIYNKLKNKYPSIIIDNKICLSTTLRQKSIINQERVDLCIVVGDKSSSNTSKLVKTGNNININTVLVSDLEDVKKLDLNDLSSISITSGASTPSYLIDEIVDYLKKD